MHSHITYLTLGSALFLSVSGTALAGIKGAVISPFGGSDFVLQVSQMSEVTSLEAVINYDVSTLEDAELSVTRLLSPARVAIDSSAPGTLRLSAKSATPLSGSGNIATLRFSQPEGASGRILSATLFQTDSSGRQSTVPVAIVNPVQREDAPPGESGHAPSEAQQEPTRESPAPAPLPAPEPQKRATEVPTTSPATTAGMTERAAASWEADAGQQGIARVLGRLPDTAGLRYRSEPSVLDRVRQLSGIADTTTVAEIFRSRNSGSFQQTPGIVLSDGRSSVVLSLEAVCAGGRAPGFVLKGAHCLALKPGGSSGWLLEAVPERGSFAASVTVLCADSVLELPLTVAPPLADYLGKGGAAEDPVLELYVRVANQLANGSYPALSASTTAGTADAGDREVLRELLEQ
jgi:hypothetical protein